MCVKLKVGSPVLALNKRMFHCVCQKALRLCSIVVHFLLDFNHLILPICNCFRYVIYNGVFLHLEIALKLKIALNIATET